VPRTIGAGARLAGAGLAVTTAAVRPQFVAFIIVRLPTPRRSMELSGDDDGATV
jgi:hypothetical protein